MRATVSVILLASLAGAVLGAGVDTRNLDRGSAREGPFEMAGPVLDVRSPPEGARIELYTDRLVVLSQGIVLELRPDRTLLVNVSVDNASAFPRQDHIHFGFDLEGNFTPTSYGGKASLCYAFDCPIALDKLSDGAHLLEARVHRLDHSPYADASAGMEIHLTLVKFDRPYSASPDSSPWLIAVPLLVVAGAAATVAVLLLRRSRSARSGCIVEDVFLIYHDGRLIDEAHRAGPDRTVDPGVLASMLTAVLEFIKDSMKTREGVRGFDYGTRRVMIAARGPLILAIALYGRETPALRSAAEGLLESVERRWPASTGNWDGSTIAFEGVKSQLSSLLNAGGKR